MKYEKKRIALTENARTAIRGIVGTRGNAHELLDEVEESLRKHRDRAAWDRRMAKGRATKHQAKSLLNALEGVRPELKREVNNFLLDSFLTGSFEQLFDRDFMGLLIIALRARVRGEASARVCVGLGKFETVHAEWSTTKEDFPSLAIVNAIAEAWKKHTRLAVSYADGAPFVEFASTVLTDTGRDAVADPRRIIKRVLQTNATLKK